MNRVGIIQLLIRKLITYMTSAMLAITFTGGGL